MLAKLSHLILNGLDLKDHKDHLDQVEAQVDQEDQVDQVDQMDLMDQVEEETIQIATTVIQTTTTVVETILITHTIQTATTVEEMILMTHTLLLITTVEETILMILMTHMSHPTVVVDHPVEVLLLQLQLTGLKEVKLPQSKTKVNAVPAGRSRPLEISLPEELSTTTQSQSITPSNNSLIAPDLSVTMDAVVELWTPLSNTSKPHHSRPQLTTHTKPKLVPAFTLHRKEQDLFLVTPTSSMAVSAP